VHHTTDSAGVDIRSADIYTYAVSLLPLWNLLPILEPRIENVRRTSPYSSATYDAVAWIFEPGEEFKGAETSRGPRQVVPDIYGVFKGEGPK